MRKLLLLFACLSTSNLYAQDVQNGQAVFQHWCSPCHAPGVRKHPGTGALQVLYKGEKPAALEERLDLTPELVEFYVRNGVNFMPPFRKTEISDSEVQDLGAYLKPGS